MTTEAETAPRRTQSERSEETRGRLLDATIESLISVGYAGTTIRRVTELAGVSQGAQSHHFPHRVDLVTSAFERLAERRIDHYRKRARELPPDRGERLRALLDLLWEDFSSPVFTVAVKLWVAAAEDEELRERLVPVEKRIYSNMSKLAAEVAGELGAEPGVRPQARGGDEHGRRTRSGARVRPLGPGEQGPALGIPPRGAGADARRVGPWAAELAAMRNRGRLT